MRGAFEPTIRISGLQATSTAVLSVTPVGFESFSSMADSIATQVAAGDPTLSLTGADEERVDEHVR